MKKYYVKLGGQHLRFKAMNFYAANQYVREQAELENIPVWPEPEEFKIGKHGKHFVEFSA